MLASVWWRRLTSYVSKLVVSKFLSLFSSFIFKIKMKFILPVLVELCLRGLLPDNLGTWWKPCRCDSLRSVKCSSGVKTWVSSLEIGLQLEHFQLNCFDCLFVWPDSVHSIFVSGGSISCIGSKRNISLWSGWFHCMSYRVRRQAFVFCKSGCLR